MPSRRNQLLAAIAAALNGPGKPAGVTVHRSRQRPMDADTLPAIVVYALEDDAQSQAISPSGPQILSRLGVGMECRAAVTGDVPYDEALDPLLTWAVQAVKADETFGGLADMVDIGRTEWAEPADLDRTYAAARLRIEVQYRYRADDPEQE
jgi:hypothetical protein